MALGNPDNCPRHIKEAIDDYVKNRHEKGGFVMSVLEDSLFDAVCNADEGNLRELPNILAYCQFEIPAEVWGTPQRVSRHLRQMKPRL